jgi:DNA-binding response OmpR family regulator
MPSLVLLVGGSPLAASIYKAILEPLKVRIDYACSVDEAACAASEGSGPDLVIADLGASSQSIPEALQAVGLRTGRKRPPVLVVTGGLHADDAPAGAPDVVSIRKPIRVEEFLALVRQTMAAGLNPPSERLASPGASVRPTLRKGHDDAPLRKPAPGPTQVRAWRLHDGPGR